MMMKAGGGPKAGMAMGKSITIDPASLPEGMVGTLKDGDIIRLRVTGAPDAKGVVTAVCCDEGEEEEPAEQETMQEGEQANYAQGGEAEGGGSWEEDLRREMSPQKPQNQAA